MALYNAPAKATKDKVFVLVNGPGIKLYNKRS